MFSLKEAIISTPYQPKSLRDNKLERAAGELHPKEIPLEIEFGIAELDASEDCGRDPLRYETY
jgi:hypothetical protein